MQEAIPRDAIIFRYSIRGRNIWEVRRIFRNLSLIHIFVPGGSDNDTYLHRLADFIRTLKNVERVEVLPYHTLGTFKWEKLGIPYPLEGVKPPTEERIRNAREILSAM